MSHSEMDDASGGARDAELGRAIMTVSRSAEATSKLHTSPAELDARARALRALTEARVPVLVGGAYAFFEYTGIRRPTKDLDIMLREAHIPEAFRALEAAGFRTDLLDADWIGKAYAGEYYIDLIFCSGNRIVPVDDGWFENAEPAEVMGQMCLIAPAEELIWSKAFVNERERYDGADVNHLILARGETLDWHRLLARFEDHWEVLFAHLNLYRFAYPCARTKVPDWLVRELCRRTLERMTDAEQRVCRGSLISRTQYRFDYEHCGFEDARPEPAPPEARPARRSGVHRRPGTRRRPRQGHGG
jgi:hypothetical protein